MLIPMLSASPASLPFPPQKALWSHKVCDTDLSPNLLLFSYAAPQSRTMPCKGDPSRGSHQSVRSASVTGACPLWCRCTYLGWLPRTLHLICSRSLGSSTNISISWRRERHLVTGNGHLFIATPWGRLCNYLHVKINLLMRLHNRKFQWQFLTRILFLFLRTVVLSTCLLMLWCDYQLFFLFGKTVLACCDDKGPAEADGSFGSCQSRLLTETEWIVHEASVSHTSAISWSI